MEYVRKTYIEFVSPGAFFNESLTQEVRSRDVAKVKVPNRAFGFRFFDILEATVEADGKAVKLTSERINESAIYYYGGRIYTRAEVAREVPDNRELLADMDSKGWDKVIRTRTGNFQPFKKTDVFIEAVA
jgi:uncharacterized protein (UPF0128 family)